MSIYQMLGMSWEETLQIRLFPPSFLRSAAYPGIELLCHSKQMGHYQVKSSCLHAVHLRRRCEERVCLVLKASHHLDVALPRCL